MTHPHPHRRATRGFTLTELAIALVVLAFVVGGIWTASGTVGQKARINNALSQMRSVVQNVRDMYAPDHAFSSTGLDVTSLIKQANLFPSDMIDSAGTPRSPWGSEITIQSGDTTRRVRYNWLATLPTDVCREMAGRLGGTMRDETLLEVRAGSTTYNTDEALDALTPISAPNCTTLSVMYDLR